ncbi:hypothetical protein SAMN05421747_10418 [Parapedobacter composti]|uniref:Uncharacterized protein n=1 Tax=Parapedobacter composti TaxID=623281 RepID=A0A1I1GDS6_9SPHI|nr:hypothetical protein SAMN05421747_10418 [Parapedobacter composti]
MISNLVLMFSAKNEVNSKIINRGVASCCIKI